MYCEGCTQADELTCPKCKFSKIFNKLMITEDYVSFETAKLLKEKGFDEKCMSYYGHGKFHLGNHEYIKSNTDRDGVAFNGVPYDAYNAPTLQMAMKWLREKHKITIGTLFKGDRIYYEIQQNNEYVFGIDTPESYAKVCDEAIKYCLKLIKND